jgi:hypothetical protein
MLTPIDLPAGFFRNGTDYQARGRWFTGDRVRWHDGMLRPIGGWEQRRDVNGVLIPTVFSSPSSQISRAMYAWKDGSDQGYIAVGHNHGVHAVDEVGTVTDISPAGWSNKDAGPIINLGYGGFYYGLNTYGTTRPLEGAETRIFNWCFRNWGEDLLAAPRYPLSSTLYAWSPGDAALVAVPNAPTEFSAMHVTSQRIVILAGNASDPRLIQWCDSEDREEWTPAVTNQAGSYSLEGTGLVQEIVDILGTNLIVTDTDAHTMRYIGPPYIFSFDKAGNNCGTIAGGAVVATDRFAVWPSARGFYLYDGTIQRLECDVIDQLVDVLSVANRRKMVGFSVSDFSEVWWLYQSDGGDEVDSYVAWDWKNNEWTLGTLDRTAGFDKGAFADSMMISSGGIIYNHEKRGVVAGDDASDVYAETGPIEIGDGDASININALVPDFEVTGDVDVTFYGKDGPTGAEITYGPYDVNYPLSGEASNQPVPVRARGRTIRMRVTGKTSTWQMGRVRLDVTQVRTKGSFKR